MTQHRGRGALGYSVIAFAMLGISSCGSDGLYSSDSDFGSCGSPWSDSCTPPSTTPVITLPPTCEADEPGVVNACGETITALDRHDPVVINVSSGLIGGTRYTVVITDPTAAEITPAGGLLISTDEDGDIHRSTVVQNMASVAPTGTYTVSITEEGQVTAAQTLTYSVEDRRRLRCTNAGGTTQSSFLPADNVYATLEAGSQTLADGTYNLYVLGDAENPVADTGVLSGTPVQITVAGGTGTVSLGTFASGAYDVVADLDGNGRFNDGVDVVSRRDRLHPCFAIQTANSGAAQQIASDRFGNRRDIFDPNATAAGIRDVHAFLTPSEVSADQTPGTMRAYVVAHQDAWNNGDALTEITAQAELLPVQDGNNNLARTMMWSRASLGGGCYDTVIDTNRNGVFDTGTDFVDNIDVLGRNTTCGMRVSQTACGNVAFTSHSSGDTTTDTAITLTGTIAGSPTESYLTITSGTQSNTIAIALTSGAFSVNLPLYTGDNHITVSGVYGDNSSCSSTITITSVTDLALFRAQLTWDGSTDMDLHVVRPGGSYSNGGGGSGDCNFSNCNVGRSGTGTNSIDWGTIGSEDDDPKLDVDCISCGNGIENIWMNQISEDGDYKVYVDAYSGSETNVTVTLYILGTAVGQVNCGSMAAGTATDSCFVGTIRWTGGTSGAGSFIPSGTKAANF